VEALQVRKYLGSGWTFGTGQDKVTDVAEGDQLLLDQTMAANVTGGL
jgi:hypothetical protein